MSERPRRHESAGNLVNYSERMVSSRIRRMFQLFGTLVMLTCFLYGPLALLSIFLVENVLLTQGTLFIANLLCGYVNLLYVPALQYVPGLSPLFFGLFSSVIGGNLGVLILAFRALRGRPIFGFGRKYAPAYI